MFSPCERWREGERERIRENEIASERESEREKWNSHLLVDFSNALNS